jgi:hypothetical protein
MSDMPPPTSPPHAPPAAPAAFGANVLVSLLIGVLFLYFGWPFVAGLRDLSNNPYGMVWPADLDYGTAWRDFGAFATAVVLLAEAAAYGVLLARLASLRAVLSAVLVLGVIGCVANLLAAGMQLKSGFTGLPLLAVVGLIVCVLSVTSARQNRGA